MSKTAAQTELANHILTYRFYNKLKTQASASQDLLRQPVELVESSFHIISVVCLIVFALLAAHTLFNKELRTGLDNLKLFKQKTSRASSESSS
jgi:hypothetical protein